MEARVRALIPDFEAYIQRGMQAFDALTIGIVAGDYLVYANRFGAPNKAAGAALPSPEMTAKMDANAAALEYERTVLGLSERTAALHPGLSLDVGTSPERMRWFAKQFEQLQPTPNAPPERVWRVFLLSLMILLRSEAFYRKRVALVLVAFVLVGGIPHEAFYRQRVGPRVGSVRVGWWHSS
jgi:hypothetical protein